MSLVYGLIWSLVGSFLAVVLGLFYKGFDRKFAARFQGRIGPPIRQPFFDVSKLMVKESVVPDTAIKWLFNSMPIMALIASILPLMFMPIPHKAVLEGHGDLILLLYLFAMPALFMIVGGLSSGSPYAVVGAQREMVMMMSYELPLAIAIIGVAYKLEHLYPGAHVFSLSYVASHPMWLQMGPLGITGMAILALTLLAVTPAEMSKIPFDVPEAETEIAGGLLVEYSGRNLALFYIADTVKSLAFSILLIQLFAPYGLSGPLGLEGIPALLVDLAFLLIKAFLVMIGAITLVRVAFARFKIDQVTRFFIIPVTLIGLAGLILISIDVVM